MPITNYRVPVLEKYAFQPPVLDKDLTSPPVSPVKGDRYIVGPSATGAWSGKDDYIAWYDGAAWKFDQPFDGWLVWVVDESLPYYFYNSMWNVSDVAGKADKVSGATDTDIATLDAFGNLTDSGVLIATVITAIAQAQTAYDERAMYDSDLGMIRFNLPS